MKLNELTMQDDWEADEGFDLRHHWNVVRRRKWAILGLAAAVSLVAALVAFSMTPVYRASTTILIESQQANVVSIEEVYELDTRSQQYYATQVEILNSRPLAETVVGALDLIGDPEFATNVQDRGFNLDWRSWLPFDVAGQAAAASAGPIPAAISAYYDRLTIEPIRNTQLVLVQFESEQPALAARVANAHAQAFIGGMLKSRVDVTESAGAWMTERLIGMEQALRESERKLQEFREKEQLVDVAGLRALPAKEVNELSSRLVAVRQTLSQAEIAYRQIANAGGASSDDLQGIPAILDDEVVQNFQQAEARAKQRVAELERRYGPMHPTMIAAQSELAEATRNLRAQQGSVSDAIRNEYESARAEEAALVRALAAARQQYQVVGSKESELNALQREVEANRKLYELFYNRIGETDVTGELESAQARIVSPAVIPSIPARPDKKRIVGLAFALSLLAGAIVAFLLESLNNSVRSSADVEEKLHRALLGMVPLLKGKRKQRNLGETFFDEREHGFSESIRTIRTAVSLDNLDHPHKVILVTSSVGNEGKSTIAINLAHAFAQTEKVLLIDADLRRPSVGRELKLPRNAPGLAELIEGKATLSSCIIRGEAGRADTMLHGSIMKDPLKILSSDRMNNALLVLSRHYDRIIIDSPPVLPVSDALALSKQAGAVIFVTKSDATPVRQINQALELLARVDARVIGVVVNQLDIRKAEKYSDYGYGGYYESYESASSAT